MVSKCYGVGGAAMETKVGWKVLPIYASEIKELASSKLIIPNF